MVKLLADDAKLYLEIANDCDTAKLQYALNSLSEWADIWQSSVSRYMLCIGHWQNATYISYGFLYIDVHAFSFVSSCRTLV